MVEWCRRRWWTTPVALFVLIRLATAFVASLAYRLTDATDPVRFLTVWDASWNALVATSGYERLLSPSSTPWASMAFFPVVPFATRAVHVVTTVSIGTAGILVGVGCGLAASVVLWRLVQRRFDDTVATSSLLLLLVAPSAFVLSMFYTEGPALLMVALCFTALDRKRWGWAGLAALAAGVMRPSGFLLLVPCMVAAYVAIRSERDWRSLWAPLLAPLGFLAWIAYVGQRAGSTFAYFDIQSKEWGSSFDFGITALRNVRTALTLGSLSDEALVNLVMLFAIGGIGLVLAFRRRLDPVWLSYALVVVVLAAGNERQTSAGRFLLLAFPLFVAFALTIPRRVLPWVASCSAMVMGALFMAALQIAPLTP